MGFKLFFRDILSYFIFIFKRRTAQSFLYDVAYDLANILQKLVIKSTNIASCTKQYKKAGSPWPVTPRQNICAGGEEGKRNISLILPK